MWGCENSYSWVIINLVSHACVLYHLWCHTTISRETTISHDLDDCPNTICNEIVVGPQALRNMGLEGLKRGKQPSTSQGYTSQGAPETLLPGPQRYDWPLFCILLGSRQGDLVLFWRLRSCSLFLCAARSRRAQLCAAVLASVLAFLAAWRRREERWILPEGSTTGPFWFCHVFCLNGATVLPSCSSPLCASGLEYTKKLHSILWVHL